MTEANMTTEQAQALSELQQKIANLVNIEGIELRNEMAALKQTLLENPEVAALLLPEDVGACVDAIRRILQVSIVSAAKEKKPAKPKPLSKDELKKMLDEIQDDDF